MQNLIPVMEMDVPGGMSVREAAKEAIEICKRDGVKIRFRVNRGTVTVESWHDVDRVVELWKRESERAWVDQDYDHERQRRFVQFYKEALAALDSRPTEHVTLRQDMRRLLES